MALLAFGLLLAIGGGAGFGSCSTGPAVEFPSGCAPFLFLLVFGVILILVGALLAVRASHYTFVAPSVDPAAPPPLINPVVIQQTTQIVRVRCRYCGALEDPSSPTCASCGAPL